MRLTLGKSTRETTVERAESAAMAASETEGFDAYPFTDVCGQETNPKIPGKHSPRHAFDDDHVRVTNKRK